MGGTYETGMVSTRKVMEISKWYLFREDGDFDGVNGGKGIVFAI